MELQLQRRFFAPGYTIGTLSINGVRFCDTLEDKNRDLNKNGDLNEPDEGKVYSETAIPFGVYPIITSVSPKFGRELPRLLNVPHFDGVLIHRGNTAADSAGCILVGENKMKGKVINSTPYEVELTKIIKAAIASGEKVIISIV